MRTARRMTGRIATLLLSGLLLMATSSCVGGNPLAAGPRSQSPLPTRYRPLLREQAQALREAIDGVVRIFPADQVEARKVLNDGGTDCYYVDGDDPDPGPAIESWDYAVRVRVGGDNADHEATLTNRLERDGWALGHTQDTGDFIAVKLGMYLTIEFLSGDDETGRHPDSENLVIRGKSRCVDSHGAIKTPAPPPTAPNSRPS